MTLNDHYLSLYCFSNSRHLPIRHNVYTETEIDGHSIIEAPRQSALLLLTIKGRSVLHPWFTRVSEPRFSRGGGLPLSTPPHELSEVKHVQSFTFTVGQKTVCILVRNSTDIYDIEIFCLRKISLQARARKN